MSSLYKRYIPPKPSAAPATVATPAVSKDEPSEFPTDGPKKRKRERTEEEIAERKAKKLRKKGIDPATVQQQNGTKTAEGDASVSRLNESVAKSTVHTEGDFSHIKNSKKRHKLEKEARKARRAVENDEEGPASVRQSHAAINGADAGKEGMDQDLETTSRLENGKQNKPVEDGLVANEPEKNEVADVHQVKSSRKKKKKSNTKRQPEELPVANDQNGNVEDGNQPEKSNKSLPQLKKRPHKLQSVLDEPKTKDAAPPDEADDHLRKHAKIMSKFAQSKQLSQAEPKPAKQEDDRVKTPPIVLDLAPLPQPEKAPTPDFEPDSSMVPRWLAEPTVVSNDSKIPFADLGLDKKVVQYLAKLGFNDAMPVQKALIPLLLPPGLPGTNFLPGTEAVLPDLAVGAPTGSGKTIAYLLPMIESIKKTAGLGRLKALVVVPTRELVLQVAAVAESLARGSKVKVGMATSTGSFKDEQNKLVKNGQQYDPHGYRELLAKADRMNYPPAQDSEDFEEYLLELENLDAREEKRIQDAISCLVDHVPTYGSAVDILIATPGRLLEHLDHTLGFSLTSLEWLVLDEADKLVDQQYDGFLEAVNTEIARPRTESEQDARERYLRSKGAWNEQRERRVRKAVLSATMTQDISKLADLKLKRPQMILVRGQDHAGGALTVDGISGEEQQQLDTSGFELPPTLMEYCVPVGDGSEKPLYLIELLEKRVLERKGKPAPRQVEKDDIESSDSESESLSSSSSASDESSIPQSNGDEESAQVNSAKSDDDVGAVHPDRLAMLERLSLRLKPTSDTSTILIFTSSTESANRLAHLLQTLKPNWAPWIKALTKADSKKSFSNTSATEPIVVVSTDRAARGLDSIANRFITQVVQYDLPRSATGYVHRVGRTARAGRQGEAWTLYTHSEARWFHKGIAKADAIKRAEAVEKVKIAVQDDEMREGLAAAVAEMRDEIHGRKGRSK